jgi:hypothetical protein
MGRPRKDGGKPSATITDTLIQVLKHFPHIENVWVEPNGEYHLRRTKNAEKMSREDILDSETETTQAAE